MALDAASYPALWGIWQATGIRPEWLLPVLYHESSLNPAASNGTYFGIGQNSTTDIQRFAGVSSSSYLALPASQQLSTVVQGYFAQYAGQIGSGWRCYQAEYLPATLGTATSLDSVIASSANDPNNFYKDNPSLDFNHDGQITLGDLAQVVSAAAATAHVKAAIKAAYAIAPLWAGLPTDPTYGVTAGQIFMYATIMAAGFTIAGLTTYELLTPRR